MTPQVYGYGRFIRLGNEKSGWAEAWFGLHYKRWATELDTPIWLHFIESEYMSLAEVRNRLKGNTYFYIPLPVGVEYDAVLESVVQSLEWPRGILGFKSSRLAAR